MAYKSPLTLIHDISLRNAIITPAGNIAVIDGIIRPNIASEGKGCTRTDDYSIKGNSSSSYTTAVGIDNLQTFTTPEGEVYGFVDKDGNLYLDGTIIKPEHPIHEYTHLWDKAVA